MLIMYVLTIYLIQTQVSGAGTNERKRRPHEGYTNGHKRERARTSKRGERAQMRHETGKQPSGRERVEHKRVRTEATQTGTNGNKRERASGVSGHKRVRTEASNERAQTNDGGHCTNEDHERGPTRISKHQHERGRASTQVGTNEGCTNERRRGLTNESGRCTNEGRRSQTRAGTSVAAS